MLVYQRVTKVQLLLFLLLACSSRLLLCQLVAEPDIASSGRYGLRLAPNRENGRRECQIECQSI